MTTFQEWYTGNPQLLQEVRAALFDCDDHIARMHGDDRGGFPAVEVLRRFLDALDALDAAPAPVAQPLTDEQIRLAVGASEEFWATSALWIKSVARTIERAHKIGGVA